VDKIVDGTLRVPYSGPYSRIANVILYRYDQGLNASAGCGTCVACQKQQLNVTQYHSILIFTVIFMIVGRYMSILTYCLLQIAAQSARCLSINTFI